MAFLFQTTFRPLLALTWQGWRPLATSDGGLGVRIGVAFRMHASPMRPHHRRGAANSLPLAVGSASPGANEAPKLQAIQLPKQTSGANVRTSAGQAGPAAEGLAVKFAGFTNSLVLVFPHPTPLPGPHVRGGTSPKYPGWI